MTRFLVVVPTHRPELSQGTIDALRDSLTYPTEFHQLDGRPSKCHAINKALAELLDPAKHDLYVTVDDDLIFPDNWQHFIACAFDRIPQLGACGIDYAGTTEGESLISLAMQAPQRQVRDILFRDITGVQNLAGGLFAIRAQLAKQIGPYPYADDGRQYHADEDGWRSHQVTRRGDRVGYVANPNGVVQFLGYDDSPEYMTKKQQDLKEWADNPVWK
jgi:hypothetical protein